MDLVDALELSWTHGAEIVSSVRVDDLTAPTPCRGWDVRALLDHTLGEAQMMTDVNRGTVSAAGGVGDGTSLTEAWREAAAVNVGSWRESGLDGDRSYFYGTFPARASVLINVGEVLVHSWDLARATQQDVVMDPDLAALVHGLYTAFPLDGMRASGQLGAQVPVPADAPVAERLLGLLGRQP